MTKPIPPKMIYVVQITNDNGTFQAYFTQSMSDAEKASIKYLKDGWKTQIASAQLNKHLDVPNRTES